MPQRQERPRAATWNEARSYVVDNRPKRWINLHGAAWPDISDKFLDSCTDERLAWYLWRLGWPMVPSSKLYMPLDVAAEIIGSAESDLGPWTGHPYTPDE